MIDLSTDSLHKFQATAGIALILFAVTVPPKFYHEVQLRKFEAQRQAAFDVTEFEVWAGQVQLLRDADDRYRSEFARATALIREVRSEERTERQQNAFEKIVDGLIKDRDRLWAFHLQNTEGQDYRQREGENKDQRRGD